jgi:hypothetical protein
VWKKRVGTETGYEDALRFGLCCVNLLDGFNGGSENRFNLLYRECAAGQFFNIAQIA